jgi:hypothetical protein
MELRIHSCIAFDAFSRRKGWDTLITYNASLCMDQTSPSPRGSMPEMGNEEIIGTDLWRLR